MRRAVRGEGGAGGHSEPFDDREWADAHLVTGLRQKTPDAFASLHEKYAAGIYSLALRMVRHTSDAEDITQDVLIRAFERLPRERRVLLRPWLYRLTLNRCYDHFRAAARRQPASDRAGRMRRRDSLGPADAEPVSPLDLFEQAELSRLFEATLNDLTRRQRAALLLKDVHGLSLVEVADCLEVTPGSVEVLLARARRAFRASYEARCLAEGRPMPSSAKVVALLPGLPLFALPPALASPPVGLPSLATPLGSPAPLVAPPVLVAAAHARGGKWHRRRARPACVRQVRRAHRRRGGDDGHGGDRRDERRSPAAAARGHRDCAGRVVTRRCRERESKGTGGRYAVQHAVPDAVGRGLTRCLAVAGGSRRGGAAGEPARKRDPVGVA